jgi:ATP-binding protein involved in chromosome partitioning
LNKTVSDDLASAVRTFDLPYLGCDLGTAGVAISAASVEDGTEVTVGLGFPADGFSRKLEQDLRAHLAAAGFDGANVRVNWKAHARAAGGGTQPIAGVSNIVAIASGKGGVGKSTTAANLALALAMDGASVGILDADIYGPSQPRMMGVGSERPVSEDGNTFEPIRAHGVAVSSIGFMIDEEQPMVWRGPMVTQALSQLMTQTRWGDLDYLIVDMPPGTGDIQLTLTQRVPVSGAVIVTTPQDIALLDARKGLKMFEKVNVPVLGVIEDMSMYVCPQCGHEADIFGTGGGAQMASDYEVTLLGQVPLDIRIREETDGGCPTVAREPESPVAAAYLEIARHMAGRLSLERRDYGSRFPNIVVEDA